jgi:fibronectin type 3 domain-containing protein
MTVASDAADSPLALSLAGTGAALPSHGVILSWAPSASDVIGYRLYRRSAFPAAYVPLTADLQSTTDYADLAVSAGETYFYVVTAVGADNVESGYADELSATIPIP